MKTFAQLKRDIKEGTTIKTILNTYKPEKNGQIRKITAVQTNAIGFEIPEEQQTINPITKQINTISWLWWGKASQYEYEGDTFKVYDEYKGNRILSFIYQILA